MNSYQNLVLLQNLYKLKAIGFDYIDHFEINVSNDNKEEQTSIDELLTNVKNCHLCDLAKSRKQSMIGFGSLNAKVMFIDFSVSYVQDTQNSYYAGKSGNMLKKMIENILLLSVEDVYLTHIVKCKPFDSNKPSSSEIDTCKNYLQAQIKHIKPKIIVTLGEDSYKSLTSDDGNFEQVRGHTIDYKKYKLIPIYHPQYILRNPNQLKKITLNDLITIKSYL